MEVRKITIVSTKTQKKSVIMSGAETLGELKNDLREAGIDYDDMTFYEGTSKTELKTDESVLPKDVPYTNRTTGETKNTNELVFMLTNTNKKIKSGSNSMTRAEAYAVIKEEGLQDDCQKKFGKNFTTCKTSDLISLIENKLTSKHSEASTSVSEYVDSQVRDAITILVDNLYNNGIIKYNIKNEILNILNKVDSSYSDNEIDAMFRDMY